MLSELTYKGCQFVWLTRYAAACILRVAATVPRVSTRAYSLNLPTLDSAKRFIKDGAWSLAGFSLGAAISIYTAFQGRPSTDEIKIILFSFMLATLAYVFSVTTLGFYAVKFLNSFRDKEASLSGKDSQIQALQIQHAADLEKMRDYDHAFRRLAVARAEFDATIFRDAITPIRPSIQSISDALKKYLIEVCNTAVIVMSIHHSGRSINIMREITDFFGNIKGVSHDGDGYNYVVLARSENSPRERYADDTLPHPVESHACYFDCLHRPSHDLAVPNVADYIKIYRARGATKLTAPTDSYAEKIKSIYVAEMFVAKGERSDLGDLSDEFILRDSRDNSVYGFITVESIGDYVFEEQSIDAALDSGIFHELGFEAVSAMRFFAFAQKYASSKLEKLASEAGRSARGRPAAATTTGR